MAVLLQGYGQNLVGSSLPSTNDLITNTHALSGTGLLFSSRAAGATGALDFRLAVSAVTEVRLPVRDTLHRRLTVAARMRRPTT